MSSPFQTLKKNRVPLFPGHTTGNRPIPFRHPEYSEDESRLLEEVTTGMVSERRKKDSTVALSSHLKSSPRKVLPGKSDFSPPGISPERKDPTKGVPSDYDLMQIMMSKITVLEKKNLFQENEVRNKDRQIKILEDKLRIAEKARKETVNTTDIKELETHCLLLQQQIHEMETFLAEYGMVWIGESINEHSDVYLDDDEDNNNLTETSIRSDSPDISMSSSNPFGFWRQNASLPKARIPPKLDFNQLIDNIKDLNVLAGEGVAQIKKTADGARFEIPEPVQLTLYANGIFMFDGPFRPYTDPATQQCVQDLMDGYFPSELQNRYPDGIPFALTDLRETHFQPKLTPGVFTGEGQTLGGEVRHSRLVPTNFRNDIEATQDQGVFISEKRTSTGHLVTTSKHPGQTLTPAQFLNKLPKMIIRDGKVIDIRDSVSKTLTGSDCGIKTNQPNVTVINTKVTKEMSETLATVESSTERPRSYKGHGSVTTLRVMTENGDHTYIVKMKFTETVGDLRTYLDAHRRPTAPYDIVSTFPYKVHRNNTLTLEESSLTPNAVLHLKPVK